VLLTEFDVTAASYLADCPDIFKLKVSIVKYEVVPVPGGILSEVLPVNYYDDDPIYTPSDFAPSVSSTVTV
jgi:hypothetical protein